MPLKPSPSAHRPVALALAAALCLSLAACGGGGDAEDDATAQPLAVKKPRAVAPSAVATTHTLEVAVAIPGYPHKVDVYRPAGATKAIVFLHGHGGRTGQLAHDLGFNTKMAAANPKNVRWDWLVANGIIAVFPQGQVKAGTTLPTWNNYVADSGQDDVAFLRALSTHVKTKYGATQVSLSGHSSGGAMTARMWCEGTPSYKAYVSMAGPMAAATYPLPGPTCTPLSPAPYAIVVGGKDSKLPKFATGTMTPTPEQKAAGLTDMILVSEWTRHQGRALGLCGETPVLQGSTATASGPTWNACNKRIRYTILSNADHPIASLEQHAGVRMADLIADFVD